MENNKRESLSLSVIALFLSALCSGVQSQGDPITISASIDKAVVQLNQRIRVSCVTHNLFPNFMTWQKQTANSVIKLATNANLEPAYSGLGSRYQLTLSYSDQTTVTFTLEIQSAHLEDAGNYSCVIPQVTGASSRFSIVVVADPLPPVVSVTDLTNNDVMTINNGDTLPLQQNILYDVSCMVGGSNPAANVTITTGPWYHPASSQVTITSNVEHTAYTGLDKQTFTVLAVNSKVAFDLFILPRTITCSTYISAGNYTSSVQQLSFNVKYVNFVPQVRCQPSTVYAMAQATSVYLKCNVTAPADNKPDFWFTYTSKDGRNITLHVADSLQKSPDGFYTADASYRDEVYVMSLAISTVQSWSFGTYNFTAINNLGSSSGYVTLSQTTQTSTKSPAGPAVGSGMLSAEASLFTTVLLTSFVLLCTKI